jgi:hypothetical protein
VIQKDNEKIMEENNAKKAKLEELQKREVTTADNKKHLCSYVGPIELSFGNRACYVGAIVIGDEVLLGAVPMEDMDLLVHPGSQQLIANPNWRFFQLFKVKFIG